MGGKFIQIGGYMINTDHIVYIEMKDDQLDIYTVISDKTDVITLRGDDVHAFLMYASKVPDLKAQWQAAPKE